MGIVLTDFQGEMPGVSNYDLPNNAASEAVDCEFGGTLRPARFGGSNGDTQTTSWPVKVYGNWLNSDRPDGILPSPLADDSLDRVYWVSGTTLMYATGGSNVGGTPAGVPTPTGTLSAKVINTKTSNGYTTVVSSAYASVARYGIGTDVNSIDQAGFDYWVSKLESGAMDIPTFVTAFLSNISYTQLITNAYASIGRTGSAIDQAGFNYWYDELSRGILTYANFLPTFYAAADFTTLINGAYQSIGIPADAQGVSYWNNQLKSGALTPQNFPLAFYNAAIKDGRTVTSAQLTKAQDQAAANLDIGNTAALESAASTVTGVTQSRSYIYTVCRVIGSNSNGSVVEESSPSDALIVSNVDYADNVEITVNGETNTNGVIYRLYRANNGAYLYVGDLTGTKFLDVIPDSALGEECPSMDWLPPPSIDGVAYAGNGFFVGWKGNSIYCSELYLPHAWPAAYTYTVKYSIKRCVPIHNGILVITDNGNYMVSGSSPSTLLLVEMPTMHPCIAVKTAVDMGDGVVYVAPTGLAIAGQSGSGLLTQGVIDPLWWPTKNWANAVAYRASNLYVLTVDGARYVFNMTTKTISTSTNLPAAGAFDQATGAIKTSTTTLAPNTFASSYVWQSKMFEFNHPTTFSFAQCIAAVYPCTVTFKMGQGAAVSDTVITFQNNKPVRFRSGGFKTAQIRIVSDKRISKLVLTANRQELEYVG